MNALALIALMLATRTRSGIGAVEDAEAALEGEFQALSQALSDLGFEDVLELGFSIVDGKLCQTSTE